VIPDDNKPNLR